LPAPAKWLSGSFPDCLQDVSALLIASSNRRHCVYPKSGCISRALQYSAPYSFIFFSSSKDLLPIDIKFLSGMPPPALLMSHNNKLSQVGRKELANFFIKSFSPALQPSLYNWQANEFTGRLLVPHTKLDSEVEKVINIIKTIFQSF